MELLIYIMLGTTVISLIFIANVGKYLIELKTTIGYFESNVVKYKEHIVEAKDLSIKINISRMELEQGRYVSNHHLLYMVRKELIEQISKSILDETEFIVVDNYNSMIHDVVGRFRLWCVPPELMNVDKYMINQRLTKIINEK